MKMGLKAAKASLRKELKAKLAVMSTDSRRLQSEKIAEQLFRTHEYQKSHRIGVYLSMKDEVQTEKIIENIFNNGKECFFPWYKGDTMKLVKLNSLGEMRTFPKTKWNIFQPHSVEDREDALDKGLDLILVPGLGFSKQGHRLGRGKGYYDKFLFEISVKTRNRGGDLCTISLAYQEQIVHEVPVTEYDYIIDKVLFTDEV